MSAKIQIVTPRQPPTKSRANVPAVYSLEFRRANNQPMKPDQLTPIQLVAVDAINDLLQRFGRQAHECVRTLREIHEIEAEYEFPRRVMMPMLDQYQEFQQNVTLIREAFEEEFKYILRPYLFAESEALQVARRVRDEMAAAE